MHHVAVESTGHVATGKGIHVLERIKELTGIYSLGFDMASFMGIVLPIAFVVVVGGGLAAVVLLM